MEFGLPLGWEERIEVRHYGALEIHLTSRFDQICFKLYAATDRGPDDKHFHDRVQLRPTKEELLTAAVLDSYSRSLGGLPNDAHRVP